MTKETRLLEQAYSPEEFETMGPQLMAVLQEQVRQSRQGQKTIDYLPPAEQLAFWQADFARAAPEELASFAEKVLARSIRFHSRGYVGHQVAVTLPITILTSALMAWLNNCTTVYELGMAGNAMEKVVLAHLAEKFGYGPGSTGVVASGGSLGNLTALVTARTSSGAEEKDFHRLAILVSGEAHYSVERAAQIMGIPTENILKIPVDETCAARTEELETLYQEAVAQGKLVFCLVGCACTTSVGAFDDLEAMGDFAQRHQIWFHVDGAHGGAAIFSEKYRHLLKGIEGSDSLILDFHKMMMTPPLSTAVLYNSRHRKVSEFAPKAAYLWRDQLSEEWWNSAKHTLECTKPITILHTYAILKFYGDELYRENVDTLFDLGKAFGDMVRAQRDMELALAPKSNIVCFRYVPQTGDPDRVNQAIADQLLADGTYYVVSTNVGGKFYLRVTLMNPFTETGDLEALLEKIRTFGKEIGGNEG